MADLTFLGIENPLGVLGPKFKNVIVDKKALDRIKSVDKGSDPLAYAVPTLDNKYQSRAAFLESERDVKKAIIEDTIENRDYILKLLAEKKYPKVRLAMCSSLNSLLKYLARFGGLNPNDRFETVIIYGHGSPGSINMGLGQLLIGPPLEFRDERHQERKKVREAFGLDKPTTGDKPESRRIRDLSTNNMDTWTNAFATINNFVQPAQGGVFHLFLMGCSVAGKKESIDTTLLHNSAERLSGIFDMNVCVSAPTAKIDDNHLDDLLKRIDTIRNACENGITVTLQGLAKKAVELESKRFDVD